VSPDFKLSHELFSQAINCILNNLNNASKLYKKARIYESFETRALRKSLSIVLFKYVDARCH